MSLYCRNPLVVEELNGIWKLVDDLLLELIVRLVWVVLQIQNLKLFEFLQLVSKIDHLDGTAEGNRVVSKVQPLDVDEVRVLTHDAQVSDLIRVEYQNLELRK